MGLVRLVCGRLVPQPSVVWVQKAGRKSVHRIREEGRCSQHHGEKATRSSGDTGTHQGRHHREMVSGKARNLRMLQS